MLDGVVNVSRLKSVEKKSPLLQRAEVGPLLLLLIIEVAARTSNVVKAASI